MSENSFVCANRTSSFLPRFSSEEHKHLCAAQITITIMMFAVKLIYLCNCCGKAWGPKATLKDFRALVWGHGRESEGEGEASTGYEKGTDTGNGHIWHRFIVSRTSHSELIISTAQSSAWHSHIISRSGIRQNCCSAFRW